MARTERDLRAELLLQARLVSSSIDSSLMESMPFEKGDRALPDFQRMNRQLRQLAAVLQSGMAPAVEFVGIYSMRLRKGDIVFGPESIPENDHRASQPGSSYEKPPPGLRELFASGQPLIVGPYTDEYGTFVSTFVPLNDSGGRRTETIIGLDVMANEWQRATLAAAAVSVGLTLLAMALLLLSVFSFRANRRVRGQQAILRESEERLRAITDSAQDAIIMQDSKGAITFWNPAAASIFGYVSEEALGRDLHNLLAPEGFPEVYRAAFHDFRRSNAADRTVELAVRRKDGQEILVCLSLSALLIGGEWHAVGILRDITERKRAEEELTRATALLQAAIEQTPAGMLIADAPDVTIRLANPAALGIRGGSAEPLTGIPVELHPGRWLTFWPDGAPVAPEDLPLSRAILKGETVRNEEVVIHRSDGEPRHVLANAAPVRNSQGEVVAGVVVFHDVTEFKQAEAALRLDDERLEVLLALNNMTGASERELTHFAMEAAVRLTNSTIGYVAFLNEDETVLTMQAWSEHAMREGENAEALVTFPLASSTGPWSEVVRQRRAVITNDT
ncbi:MAG: PAS domain S-box protein, partial [Syntrophaceae bacterium]|nr:PAS domain S-box protein [Syntrophaceae bacterium]